MQRRQLLRGALAGGLTTTSLGLIADVLTQADHALAVKGSADLAHQEAVTEQHSYGYQGRFPAEVLADLIADFAEVTPLLRRPQPARTGTVLSRIMGQLGGMVAVVLHDLGNRREAGRPCEHRQLPTAKGWPAPWSRSESALRLDGGADVAADRRSICGFTQRRCRV